MLVMLGLVAGSQSRQVQLIHDAPVGRYVTTSFCKGQAQLMLITHDARVGWTVAKAFQRTQLTAGFCLGYAFC